MLVRLLCLFVNNYSVDIVFVFGTSDKAQDRRFIHTTEGCLDSRPFAYIMLLRRYKENLNFLYEVLYSSTYYDIMKC